MGQFLGGALGDLPLFVAGIDEGQVFLAIIVESKRAIVSNVFHLFAPRGFLLTPTTWCFVRLIFILWMLLMDVIANALRRLQGNVFAGA